MKQRTATTACFLSLLLINAALAGTETSDEIIVQLRINRNYEQDPSTARINLESVGPTPGVKADGTTRLGKAPGGTLVGLETVSDQPNSYRIMVDSNGDGNLDNDIAQIIQEGLPFGFLGFLVQALRGEVSASQTTGESV